MQISDEELNKIQLKFIDRLKYSIKKNEINQTELAKKVGLSKQTISGYLNGLFKPNHNTIYSIAKVLNVNPAWLLGIDDEEDAHTEPKKVELKEIKSSELFLNPDLDLNIDSYTIKQNQDINTIPRAKKINTNSKIVSLPILGTVPAGFGKNPFFEIDEWTECPVDILPYSENPEERYYILKVSGDSMYPLLLDRDLIIVDIKKELNNGDIGVFRIDDETTVKTYYKFPDRIELDPYNKEAFKTMVYPLKQLQELGFEIQGKVIGLYFRPI